jgi:hypothetical protein
MQNIKAPDSLQEYGDIETYEDFVKWHFKRIRIISKKQWTDRLGPAWEHYQARRKETQESFDKLLKDVAKIKISKCETCQIHKEETKQ